MSKLKFFVIKKTPSFSKTEGEKKKERSFFGGYQREESKGKSFSMVKHMGFYSHKPERVGGRANWVGKLKVPLII